MPVEATVEKPDHFTHFYGIFLSLSFPVLIVKNHGTMFTSQKKNEELYTVVLRSSWA